MIRLDLDDWMEIRDVVRLRDRLAFRARDEGERYFPRFTVSEKLFFKLCDFLKVEINRRLCSFCSCAFTVSPADGYVCVGAKNGGDEIYFLIDGLFPYGKAPEFIDDFFTCDFFR